MRGVKVLLLLLAAICVLGNVNCRDFGYNGVLGPEHWGEQFSKCGGKHQSPININLLNVIWREFTPLNLTNFRRAPLHAELVNNGHTVVVRMDFDGNKPTVSGGPLNGTFVFSQFHFHWGENDTIGSEDRINNQSFPAELHVVFRNQKYATFEEAVVHSNGVAVLAFFYAIQQEDNPNYVEFTNLLEYVLKPEMMAKFHNPPTLEVLISANLYNYYTYVGSLTTPPCSEDVTWIDFLEPIKISTHQIERFRRLYTYDNVPMTHNFRPVQPLNNRNVYAASPTRGDVSIGSIPFVDNLSGGAANLKAIGGALALALTFSFWMLFTTSHFIQN